MTHSSLYPVLWENVYIIYKAAIIMKVSNYNILIRLFVKLYHTYYILKLYLNAVFNSFMAV